VIYCITIKSVLCSDTVAQDKVDELSQQLQEINMKVDELQNKKMKKISTLEKSITSVKERCAAKLKICTAERFIRVYFTGHSIRVFCVYFTVCSLSDHIILLCYCSLFLWL